MGIEQWFKDTICDYINTESEEYCKLSDEQIIEIAESIYLQVMEDKELNNVLCDTIKWYVNYYINNILK